VSAFLNQHSQANYSDFCLAYRFTYRDFDGGVVGLAYIAPQPGQNLRGGICDRLSGGRTLNTGIVTSVNFNRRIPPSLSALTFAHEAGHNFGSNVSPRR
jgi:disintegrin and metalloproteinase domain-containing protein 10